MKENQIIFSTPMVQAILEGRKTMTRRIVKCYTRSETHPIHQTANWHLENKTCPYGQPGDVLWVREKFARTDGKYEPEITYSYFADSFHWSFFPDIHSYGETSCQWHDPDLAKEVAWKPSIHMPKSAARIWLQVKEIRVERLQDISEDNARREGVKFAKSTMGNCYHDYETGGYNIMTSAYSSFRSLWRKINGRVSWDANPWVWVIEFKVLSTTGRPQLETLNLKLETEKQ